MSDQSSAQYRVIRSLYSYLVEAVSPVIDTLITRAWSKNLIEKHQLDISLEPNSTDNQKATTFVSVIATRVNIDSKAFDQFVSLLREISCMELAKYLIDELAGELDAGASVSPHQSPANNRRPHNQIPKLDQAEDMQEKESGFVEDETIDTPANDDLVHVPDLESQLSNKAKEPLVYLRYESPQRGRTKSDKTTRGGATLLQSEEEEVEKVRRKYEQKNKTIAKLKDDKGSVMSQLEEQKQTNKRLLEEIEEKEIIMQYMKTEHEAQIQSYEEELKVKTEEVQRIREQLAIVERNKEEQRVKYEKGISKLQKELKGIKEISHQEIQKLETDLTVAQAETKLKECEIAELRSKIAKKKEENKRNELTSREEIVQLKEKLHEMKDREHKLEMSEQTALSELEQEKRRNSEAEVQLWKQTHEMTLQVKDARIQHLTNKLKQRQT